MTYTRQTLENHKNDKAESELNKYLPIGTKTLLFGVHQVFLHPLLVTISWVLLYRSLPTLKELFCIFIHDWGYWGKRNLKDADGDNHPEFGARLAGELLGHEWGDFILGHSNFYMIRTGVKKSKLFNADKYWHCIIPLWVYKLMSMPTGEFKHYREVKHARQVTEVTATDEEWWIALQKVCNDKVSGTFEINTSKLAK